MARIEILVEERSMKELLSVFLPKILPETWILDSNYFIRSFEGKSDLQKQIPIKVRTLSNWTESVGVIILQDQDSADCKILKRKLVQLCVENGNCPNLVRIVCRELEAWYFGDLESVEQAYPTFKSEKHKRKAKYRNPDLLNNAAQEFRKILPEFQKVGTAKKIAPFLTIENNNSESFNQFVRGVQLFFNSIK